MIRAAAVGLLVVAGASAAFGGDDGVSLPLGPFVRPGRPLVVRVKGGADRVRADGTPWALPQGERGDEFVLPIRTAAPGALTVMVDRGGVVTRASVAAEVLPSDGVVACIGPGETPPADATRAIALTGAAPPSVAAAWLLFDRLGRGVAPGAPHDVVERLAAARPEQRGVTVPLLAGPDPAAFAALSAAARGAAALPARAATLLIVLAGAELALVVALRGRDLPPWRRAAWLASPPVAASLWLVAAGGLPGAVAASAVALETASERVVYVRVEARRDADVRFLLPRAARFAAVFRYAADDATAEEASVGDEVAFRLAARESRVFAYALPAPADGGGGAAGGENVGEIPSSLLDWLAPHGFEAAAGASLPAGHELPESASAVVIPVASAMLRALSPAK